MTMPYYRLMGQILIAIHSWDDSPDVREAGSKAGLTKDRVEAGRHLVDKGQALVVRRQEEGGGDRIALHSIHMAAAELEMWLQTLKFSLRGRVDDASTIEAVMHAGVHADDHAVTVVAQALRALGMLRTDPAIAAGFERRQSLRDLIVRGSTLLAKMMECTALLVRDNVTSRTTGIYADLATHQDQMAAWVREMATSAEQLESQPEILGLLGFVPEHVGLPAGGTSYAVTLHERAQRQAPDPAQAGSTSGWSVGRQGRNRENMGKGWVEPTFEP